MASFDWVKSTAVWLGLWLGLCVCGVFFVFQKTPLWGLSSFLVEEKNETEKQKKKKKKGKREALNAVKL